MFCAEWHAFVDEPVFEQRPVMAQTRAVWQSLHPARSWRALCSQEGAGNGIVANCAECLSELRRMDLDPF